MVAVVGLQFPIEAEDHDRDRMGLPAPQLALLQAVSQGSAPLIVVLVSGAGLGGKDIAWVKANAAAVLQASYGGEMGGEGIASVLTGEFNPSGKLPFTSYPESFESRPRYLMDMRALGGVTHRFYKADTPIWPFGHGRSYSSFEIAWESEPTVLWQTGSFADNFHDESVVVPVFEAAVRNTGGIEGSVVVLGFLAAVGRPDEPVRELFGFEKLLVAPGSTVAVQLPLPASVVATVDAAGCELLSPGRFVVTLGDLSAFARVLAAELAVEGGIEVLANYSRHLS